MRKQKKHSKKNKKNNQIRRMILTIMEIILLGIVCYSGYKIIVWIKENNESKNILENVQAKVTIVNENNNEIDNQKKYDIDFIGLKEINAETKAWIKINNMRIEYPVVQAKDNDYYLTRSFDKSYNSAGWIFMDYRNKADGSDRNIVIYGHNRKDGSMFGDLKDIFTEEWYENEDNMYITYITENEYCTYEIFSAYRIEAEDYYITTGFKSDEEFDTFVKKMKARSFRNFGVEVSKKDKIITLSTCSNADYRVVVHAKKIIKSD